MNFKKLISGVSAFAIATSAFAAMTVTASAATSYSEDFSSVEDAAGWWDSVNGEVTASVTEGGAMQLHNNSTSGNRENTKAITVSGNKTLTIDADITIDRGDRAHDIAFTDASGNVILKINTGMNTADGNWNALTVSGSGEGQLLDGNNVQGFHLNAVTDYTAGTTTLKFTNRVSNRGALADVDATVETNAVAGNSVKLSVTVRRNGTATIDNLNIVGEDEEVTGPTYEVSPVAGGDNYAYTAEGEVEPFGGSNGAENAAASAAAAYDAGVTDTYIAGKINTFTVTSNDDKITNVKVNHNDGKFAESNTEIAANSTVNFTILSTTHADSQSALQAALGNLGGSTFTVEVTVE